MMPTVFAHAVAGVAIGAVLRPPTAPARYWILGAACACLPDADVVAFSFGIPYAHPLGHRGLSHSLCFAGVISAAVVAVAFRQPEWAQYRIRLLLYFFLATASHGILDAMTNGGLGIAFFAPFDTTRYFLPFRPIKTSPISPRQFVSWYGVAVLRNEFLWIWLPSLALIGGVWWRSGALARKHARHMHA